MKLETEQTLRMSHSEIKESLAKSFRTIMPGIEINPEDIRVFDTPDHADIDGGNE